MTKYNKALALLLTLASGVFCASASAAEKIGVIDVQAVFQQLPQAAAIESNINAEFKDRIEEIQRLQTDIKFYMEKQQREAATMSAAQKKELEDKIRTLGAEYQEKAKPLDQDLRQRQGEERNRLLGLIKQSIDKVGAAQKYDIILQSSAVAYLGDEADNLTAKVIEEASKMK
ncbi:OmpH family outer membrane protein [Catenovulum agarivorans]|uniref:OmpH family outer membrane protein n=1 Tax=Catenovulum agarivorans TaxID=1172192 RepID=UPI0002EED95D|nr:OmpH family outer membrane protein [Catenovulum agarivorans]